MGMSKVSKAQRAAVKRYDAKRPKKPVSIRLSDDEMAKLDAARGEDSRAAFLLAALKEKLG